MAKTRSAALVVFLTVITAGLYWFYWAGTSFSEVAEEEKRQFRAGQWVLSLIVLSIPIAGIAIYQGIGLAKILVYGGDLEGWAQHPYPSWMESVNIIVTDGFLVVQFFFLRKGTEIVRDATTARGLAKPPSVALVLAMTLTGITGLVPFWGSFFSIASVVVWIVWNVQIQNSMNRYWRHVNAIPRLVPRPGTPA